MQTEWTFSDIFVSDWPKLSIAAIVEVQAPFVVFFFPFFHSLTLNNALDRTPLRSLYVAYQLSSLPVFHTNSRLLLLWLVCNFQMGLTLWMHPRMWNFNVGLWGRTKSRNFLREGRRPRGRRLSKFVLALAFDDFLIVFLCTLHILNAQILHFSY